jgi:DNA-directed RNA polymerase sigma subunit (sigma70/sigma32)
MRKEGNENANGVRQMTPEQMIAEKVKATPHMEASTHAYYWGKNAAWTAIAENAKEVKNPFSDKELRFNFARGARHAMSEERLSLDLEWD